MYATESIRVTDSQDFHILTQQMQIVFPYFKEENLLFEKAEGGNSSLLSRSSSFPCETPIETIGNRITTRHRLKREGRTRDGGP